MFVFKEIFTCNLTDYSVNCIYKISPDVIISVGCVLFKFFMKLCPRVGRLQNRCLQVLVLLGKGICEHRWKVLKPVQQPWVSEELPLTPLNIFFPSSL